MAMSFLVDTNVFLEILLNQPGRAKCGQFLQQNSGALAIADFSLHSIGVIALHRQQAALFADFLNDSLPNLELLHLDRIGYPAVAHAAQIFNLDFDDAYQFTVAKAHGLAIATQDQHFTRVKNEVEVRFL
jgi:predicted nucleic acid-binding protein